MCRSVGADMNLDSTPTACAISGLVHLVRYKRQPIISGYFSRMAGSGCPESLHSERFASIGAFQGSVSKSPTRDTTSLGYCCLPSLSSLYYTSQTLCHPLHFDRNGSMIVCCISLVESPAHQISRQGRESIGGPCCHHNVQQR